MPDEEVFSKRLQRQRIEKGLSQNALAKKIGLSRNLYNKYEKAGIRPPYQTLILLANELNTTVDYLICNTESQPLFIIQPKAKDSCNYGKRSVADFSERKRFIEERLEYLNETIKLLEMKKQSPNEKRRTG